MPDGTPTASTALANANSIAGVTEVIRVDQRTVACDGGGGALGHPRVFLRIPNDQVMCPYCSRLYVLNEDAGDTGH
ncbi:MAG: zinc-finger domain-containing protein [Proteobacteria bacterium]|nr:zinc-finger domain-containing protein [Pseudomonadota bacterium]